jgi:hypothetical protein
MVRDPLPVLLHNHERKPRRSGFIVLFFAGEIIEPSHNHRVRAQNDRVMLAEAAKR